MNKHYFVTGTDTEVGKTVASYVLLQAAKAAGYRTAGYKPATSGSEKTPKGLHNSDALALQRNSSLQLDYAVVNPYTFAEPTSSHIISTQEDRPIEALVMSTRLHALEQQADWALVEGAGGRLTPLSDTLIFADWVTQGQLPVILVVGMKLDCINHAILTTQAVLYAGLALTGWVVSDIISPGERHAEYMTTFTHMTPAPLLGEIPWLAENPEGAAIGKCINFALVQSPCVQLNCGRDCVSDRLQFN